MTSQVKEIRGYQLIGNGRIRLSFSTIEAEHLARVQIKRDGRTLRVKLSSLRERGLKTLVGIVQCVDASYPVGADIEKVIDAGTGRPSESGLGLVSRPCLDASKLRVFR